MFNDLPTEIENLPELYHRIYRGAPAEIVPLKWVAQQAGYSFGGLMNKVCAGIGPKSFISGKRRCCDRKEAVLWILDEAQFRESINGEMIPCPRENWWWTYKADCASCRGHRQCVRDVMEAIQ